MMIVLLVLDFILSFNTIFYEFGQQVTKRLKIAQYVFGKSYGLECLSILMLIIIWGVSAFREHYEIKVSSNWY